MFFIVRADLIAITVYRASAGGCCWRGLPVVRVGVYGFGAGGAVRVVMGTSACFFSRDCARGRGCLRPVLIVMSEFG